MKLLLTSGGVSNRSIRDALVEPVEYRIAMPWCCDRIGSPAWWSIGGAGYVLGMNDAEVASLLAGCVRCPYPGTWQSSPFAERTIGGARYALVAVDPGLSALVLRRDDGSLWCLPDDGAPHLVNSSVEAFIAFNRAYEETAAEADAYEGPGDGLNEDEAVDLAEQAADALTEALLERFGVLDAKAIADENSFWHIGAEELGYGMSV